MVLFGEKPHHGEAAIDVRGNDSAKAAWSSQRRALRIARRPRPRPVYFFLLGVAIPALAQSPASLVSIAPPSALLSQETAHAVGGGTVAGGELPDAPTPAQAFIASYEQGRSSFVISHPSDKNKNVARMGHPQYLGQPAAVHLWTQRAWASQAAPHEQGRLRVEVSHPFAGEEANGWGTEHLWDTLTVHPWPSLAVASWAASRETEAAFISGQPIPGPLSEGQSSALPTLDRTSWNAEADSNTESSLEPVLEPGSGNVYVALKDCPADQTHARECRMHWKQMGIESSLFNAFENAGNVYTGYWYRWETTHGHWWQRYIDSAAGWRWDRWSDNNPFLDDYIAHPMMGAITNSIWIQNDPKGMTLEFANNRPYWRSRLRATAWSTFYSFEWKLGPFGEASIGHNGDHYFEDKGVVTNETGWVELVTTPVGGLGWTVLEDYLDKHVVSSLEERNRNPVLLTVYQFITPARGVANILRFRPPWYRDSRVVKTSSVWSDPGEGLSATSAEATRYAARHSESGAGGEAASVHPAVLSGAPGWQGPGGRHEFGAWWGLSAMSGHIWGFAGDVKYMPVDLRYSYEFYRHRETWTMRYSPEMTALALLDWPTPNATATGTVFNQRTRAYGSGISPVGFQADFWPMRRVQPFFSGNGGFIYFDKRVLSPQGSQFMYTVDYGAGFNVFHHKTQAITIGYRYQHISNANISLHNPGTDANTFYVGVSRFRTRGDRRPESDLR